MVDYIDRFLCVEPFLHLWDKVCLIIVDDFTDVFLDSVCSVLLSSFVSMFIRYIGLLFSFFVMSLCGLYVRVTVAL